MALALTPKQKEVLDFIVQYIHDRGFAPSYREIATGLELASPSTVHVHVQALRQRGYLRDSEGDSGNRELEPTDQAVRWGRSVVLPLIGLITAGQPITRGSLVGPEDRGFLAAALGPGMRAISVPVNASTGVAGFVFPGDHVDLVLTQTVEGGGDGPPLKASETVVRNARVLATDQRVTDKGEDGKVEVKTFTNVTIEVTPAIAEKVAVSQSIGTLSLSLRAISDNAAELERAVAAGDVKIAPGTDPRQEKKILFAVANRPVANNPTFTTGGDVSRFQRRTVPGRPPKEGGASGPALSPLSSVPSGPVVRVARGNEVAVIPVGAR